MSESEVKNVLQLWSSSKLYQFLKLRRVEVPSGVSFNELVSLALENRNVPILQVKATRMLFHSLSHEQLVKYLQGRGYVIMTKGKMIPQTPEQYVDIQERELLAGAIGDFDEHYSTQAEEIDYMLGEALKTKSPVRETVPEFQEDKTDVPYNPRNVEKLLEKFGVEFRPITLSNRLRIARVSVNFFCTGDVY